MQLPEPPDRITRHIAAFNAAVRTGEWAAFADRFTTGATMAFTAVPTGSFTGRAAIAAAYADHPPTDTMAVRAVTSAGLADTVSFAWTAGGTGTMQLTWESGLVARLDVSFDD